MDVARGLASHLRLKLSTGKERVIIGKRRQGPGISSEIETVQYKQEAMKKETSPGAWHLI